MKRSRSHSLCRLATVSSLALSLSALPACGGSAGSRGSLTALDAVERARATPGAREGATLAPQEYGEAERDRALAKKAHEDGDDVAAGLYAEHALAAYEHASVLARLARAQSDESKAQTARTTAQTDARRLAQETLVPTSRPEGPQREAARLLAARSLATQARLLCGAARLLSPTLEGLAEAEKEATDLEKKLDGNPRPAPIDAATHARVSCLTVLTKVRRSSGAAPANATSAAGGGGSTARSGGERASPGQADALLAELSAAGNWSPFRDERGVIVTLRDAFTKSASLTADGESKLKELGRILAAHPNLAVQVVVHDATPPSAQEATVDKQRADAAAKTIASAANSTRVQGEVAAARAPIVDPSDTKLRARNARLDVVFVTPND